MQLSINYLSELTGIDRRRVTAILRDLPSTQGPHRARQYQSQDALRALYAPDGTDGTLNAGQERARLDAERRRQLELANAKTEGLLLDRDAVASAWAEQIAIAKGRLLALPSRVSGEILRLKTQREIERVIKDAVIVILEELANDAARYGLSDGDEKTL